MYFQVQCFKFKINENFSTKGHRIKTILVIEMDLKYYKFNPKYRTLKKKIVYLRVLE